MSRDTIDHTHGDTGTKPPDTLDFVAGEEPSAEYFDWWWYQVAAAINGHASEFDRLDSNDDGIVDEADVANGGDSDTYKGNDIDSDGDGVVDQADYANDADKLDGLHADAFHQETKQAVDFIVENRTSDPSNPSDGRLWLRTDL